MRSGLCFMFLLLFVISGFAQSQIPYDLNNPDKQIVLPEILNEVSGLTDIDNSRIACVQDELGIIFVFDFVNEKIVAEHKFDAVGDFEGLTRTGSSMFVLRSDGRLTEWKNFNPDKESGVKEQQQLPLLTANNEGLCFDARYNRLRLLSA